MVARFYAAVRSKDVEAWVALFAADATGFWFAAVALCAALAAGLIVYQTGNSDMVTASNDVVTTGNHVASALPR